MTFKPLPLHEYEPELQKENRDRAAALIRRMTTGMRTVNETILPPKKCPACHQDHPLIKYSRFWLCRGCAQKRDRELETRGARAMPSDNQGRWV